MTSTNPAALAVTPDKLSGCILCGRAATCVGVFVPTESFAKRIGQPKGKQRMVLYGLCVGCAELADWSERVESAIVTSLGVQ